MCVGVYVCVSRPACCVGGFFAHSLRGALLPQTALFMLPLGFTSSPFTRSLPTGGRRDGHQVSAVNDNLTASVAF